jgi:hypothetical protein
MIAIECVGEKLRQRLMILDAVNKRIVRLTYLVILSFTVNLLSLGKVSNLDNYYVTRKNFCPNFRFATG